MSEEKTLNEAKVMREHHIRFDEERETYYATKEDGEEVRAVSLGAMLKALGVAFEDGGPATESVVTPDEDEDAAEPDAEEVPDTTKWELSHSEDA